MSLVDLLRAPWAILPDRLDEIQAVYGAHFRGEKVDLAAVEARLGKKLVNEPPQYEVRRGGVGVLTIEGVIAPKANLFTQISGGATAQQLVQQIEAMQEDAAIRGVVIAWDSPGGSVHGIPTLERAIRALSEAKPTASVSDGVMASAAYWAGAAANTVFMSGETDTIGSIGVVATHTYDPRSSTRQVTEIVAGRYKRMATDSKPLSAEGEAYLQAQVDEIYAVFLEAVARNRGVSLENVLAHMADGRVFIGRQAQAAGLVDGIATVEEAVGLMAMDPNQFATRRRAAIAALQPAAKPPKAAAAASSGRPDPLSLATAPGAEPVASTRGQPVPPPATPTQPTGAVTMTPQEQAATFAAEHPEAAAHIRGQGAAAELQRQKDVRAAALPGHEKLIEAMAADGKTTGNEAATAVIAAERQVRQAQATARSLDAPAPLRQEPAPAAQAPSQRDLGREGRIDQGLDVAALDAAVRRYQAQHPGTSYVAAVKAVQAEAGVTA
jgi:signal peptide peptidase SppA